MHTLLMYSQWWVGVANSMTAINFEPTIWSRTDQGISCVHDGCCISLLVVGGKCEQQFLTNEGHDGTLTGRALV